MLELIVREGAQAGTTFRLAAERTWVGRQSSCDVILHGEGISRVHFLIGKTESGYALTDNKSTNGVYVNGVQITHVALRSGDRIEAGSAVLEVREVADPGELPFRFVVIRKGFEQTPQIIEQPGVLIGRQNNCDIQLNDPHVSRRHAELEYTPAGISITDLSSMGAGIYVNGLRIVSQQLRHGDTVLIRPFEIRVVILEGRCLLGIRDCSEEMPAAAANVPSGYKEVVTAPARAEAGGAKPSAAIASLPEWAQEKAPIWVPTSDIMPNRFRSAMLATGLFAALGLAAYAWMSSEYGMYSPGPTASVHSMLHAGFKEMSRARHLPSECAACHSGFTAAPDTNCQSCHSGLHPAQKHKTAMLSCASCHREHQGSERQLLLGVGPTCQSAGCHTQVHQNPALAAVSRQVRAPQPVSKAVAFEAPFDFSGDKGKDFHPEHKKAQVICAQCHDDAEAEKKVPREVMRSRCLACHGFGPEKTLQARCYSCHFEHPTKTPDKILLAASFADGQLPTAPSGTDRQGTVAWWVALVGTGLAMPLLYLAGAVGAFGYSYARYRGKIVRTVRDGPVPSVGTASMPAWDAVLAAATGTLRAPVEPKPADNQPPGGHQRPQIDLDLCVGCGSCVQVCPFEVLEIVNEKAIAARLADCTGYAACAAECPTNAITLVTGGAMQTVELPQYSAGLETNVPGLYLAGEVTGRALIKIAINQGKKAADSIMQSRPPAGAQQFDVIVVGGGPAGISTALACLSSGLRVKVFEQGTIANTIRNYSRQKFVMAEPVAIPLYGPLWMADTSKEALLQRWMEIIATTGLKVSEEEKVLQVARHLDLFAVRTSKGEYTAARVVLAIGKRGSPRKLGVPGEDSAKVAYNLSDVDSYRGHAICVVGGGDSAIEVANGLARANLANRVCLVHRGPDFNRAKPRNQRKLENSLQDERLTLYLGSSVLEIRERSIVVQTPRGAGELANDFVFVMAGGESPKQFLADCGIGFSNRAL